MRTITIPMSPSGYDDHGLRTEHVIHTTSMPGARYGKRFGIGSIPKGAEGRKVHKGPMVPGPWAYAFGLATVLAANPALSTGNVSRRKVDEGTEHFVEEGDHLIIDGLEYEIRFTNGFTDKIKGEFIELIPA